MLTPYRVLKPGVGFIATETSTTDDLGLLEIRTKVVKGKTKTKGKHANPRKNLQKANYLFNKSSKRTPAYKDYFNPDHATENRMLGLSDLVGGLRSSFSPFLSNLLGDRRPASNLTRILTQPLTLLRRKPHFPSLLNPKHKKTHNFPS